MQAMLGNTSSAGSAQIGAGDSKGGAGVDDTLGGTSTQGTGEGKDGECALGCPDNAATDTVKLSLPCVKQSSFRRWVNTLNVNICVHDAAPCESGRFHRARNC